MTKRNYLLAVLAATSGITLLSSTRPTPVVAQSSDPCATATATVATSAPRGLSLAESAKTIARDHPGHQGYLDALWVHRATAPRNQTLADSVIAQSEDVGAIAVLQDAGDLMVKANAFDLMDVGVRLTPNSKSGYDVSRISYEFRQPLGSAVGLADDDSREVGLSFAFPFFGQRYSQLFVNSDGNLTFGEADNASTDRSVSRLLGGPPRIAPFFADLDPSTAGRVLTSSSLDAYTVTWCGVPEFGGRLAVTAQATLFPSGVVEMQTSNRTTMREAIVGISPGRTTEFTPADLTSTAGTPGGAAAVGERFTTASELDTVSTVRRFLATHADDFDNVTMFTDTELLVNGFAYELTIGNQIQGLNLQQFDAASDWGSAGRLQSLLVMDALTKYPDDPAEKFNGENNTVSIMGQEFGHRWLAALTFRDQDGRTSNQLLGRDDAHWSFFFDSDGSVMEGNDIEDLGGGAFRTIGAVNRYSLLDQYAMGLVDKSQVPPFFYVQSPINVVPPRTPTSAPRIGVTFNGTRRDVTIADVTAALGDRVPSAADSRREYKQAFIYVTSKGRTAGRSEIEKVDRIRVAWDQFLSAATDSRMQVDTELRSSQSSQRGPQ